MDNTKEIIKNCAFVAIIVLIVLGVYWYNSRQKLNIVREYGLNWKSALDKTRIWNAENEAFRDYFLYELDEYGPQLFELFMKFREEGKYVALSKQSTLTEYLMDNTGPEFDAFWKAYRKEVIKEYHNQDKECFSAMLSKEGKLIDTLRTYW